ncbi:MAG: ABC transporter permease [Coprothermobacterota bacterium]|nr:ABC transporter permease [Coprothermobacterota bacterium]
MSASLDRIWALALRVIRQFRRDRRTLALLFLAPLFVMSLLAYMIQSPSSSVRLGLSLPSAAAPLQGVVEEALRAQGLEVTVIQEQDARELLEEGKLDAALLFPQDLLQVLAAGGQPKVELWLEGSEPSINGEVMARLTAFLHNLSVSSPRQGVLPNLPALPELVTTYLYGGADFTTVSYLAPAFVSFFIFFFVFLLSAVSFLRERSRGTIERLLVSPLGRGEIVLGYALGFLLFALVQSAIILLFSIYVLGIHYLGSLWLVYLVNFLVILSSVGLGIFLSAFARNELQAVQFIPIVVIPQILLGGFFWPLQQMAPALRWIAQAMPMTYAIQALKAVMVRGQGLAAIWPQLLALLGFTILFFLLAALSVRKMA